MSTTDASRYLARADAVAGVEHVPPRAGLPEPKQPLGRGDVLSPGERGRHASGARP
ncbi:MAG TPA: hypothetical protein VFH64_09955 [Amnibacterium sp.]|nr:hypothetical protein [Amnibacterium sp.]